MRILERDRQLALLEQWRAGIPSTGGFVALVAGEAGVGKTALLRAFVRKCERDARVLWGACDPLATPQPLGPLHDVGRQVGGALGEALHRSERRERIFALTLDLLENESESVILVLEDLHWADEATLDLLRYLGRRIARTRAMVLASFRDDEVTAFHPLQVAIGHLPGESVRRLKLAPLSEAAVAELASEAGRDAAGLFDATAGNPFYVTEVLAAPAGDVPVSVRDAVLARLSRLSPSARAIADLAALVPGRIERWLIDAMLGANDAAVDECKLCGMEVDEDGAIHFRHELSRRALEDQIGAAHSRALHARMLSLLASATEGSVSEARLLHHAVRAADAEAVIRLGPPAATHAAAIGAHREAVAHLRAVLELGTRLNDAERGRLLDALAYELYVTGQIEASMEVRSEALQLWRAKGDALKVGDTLRWLSRLHWFRGEGEIAERRAMEAVEVLQKEPESKQLAMAYSAVSNLAMLAARNASAIEWGEKAIALARRLGDVETLAHALNNVGSARICAVGDTGWLEMTQSLEVALQHGLQDHVARGYSNLFSAAVSQRDYVTADLYLDAGLSYCEERELDAWGFYIRAYRARARFEQGSWGDALADAQELLRHPDLSVAHRLPVLVVVARVRARRGDDDPGGPLEEATRLAIATAEPQRMGAVCLAKAEIAWLQGDTTTAAREAQTGLAYALRGANSWMNGELAYWVWCTGGRAPEGLTLPEPFFLQMQGDALGASRAWDALGCRYEAARALSESADASHRRRALELFDALGAAPMARRVRAQLRSEGVKGLKRGANRSTRANPAGLTARELQILALLAGNLSNAEIAKRLFVSRKTVGHHASAILAKLGITSRHQAADAARQLGIDLELQRGRRR